MRIEWILLLIIGIVLVVILLASDAQSQEYEIKTLVSLNDSDNVYVDRTTQDYIKRMNIRMNYVAYGN